MPENVRKTHALKCSGTSAGGGNTAPVIEGDASGTQFGRPDDILIGDTVETAWEN